MTVEHVNKVYIFCSYDFLRVFDGGSLDDPLLVELSGPINPLTEIQSTGYELYLRFQSDTSQNAAGFEILFEEGL